MIKLPYKVPLEIIPGLVARFEGREGGEVSYQPDGAGGVTVRIGWRDAMDFWLELHLTDNRMMADRYQPNPLLQRNREEEERGK